MYIDIKKELPTNDDQLVLFVQIHKFQIHANFCGKWSDVKKFREYDLKNNYTHWVALSPLENKLSLGEKYPCPKCRSTNITHCMTESSCNECDYNSNQ